MVEKWRTYAACDGMGPELFYSFIEEEQAQAIAICELCGVREICLQYSLDNKEEYGVWGGMNGPDRVKLRRRIMRQARTKKQLEASTNG